MARIATFTIDDAFPLAQVNINDRRFMSRLNKDDWEDQVKDLMVQIEHEGQMSPVGIARLSGEQGYVVIYGFTRTAAVARLDLPTIRANVYEDLDEATARMLNAGDNAWHIQLTDWERAVQMQKLRAIGIPVESANGSQSLTSIFGMSKRTIFNWLGIVGYDAPALHQAIAEKKLGLQHALVFRDYPPAITEAWVERCIEGEWSSKDLKLQLLAVDEQSDDRATLRGVSSQAPAESATMHGQFASQPMPGRATLHGDHEAVLRELVKACRYIQRVTQQQIDAWDPEELQEVKTGLRMALKPIIRHQLD